MKKLLQIAVIVSLPVLSGCIIVPGGGHHDRHYSRPGPPRPPKPPKPPMPHR